MDKHIDELRKYVGQDVMISGRVIDGNNSTRYERKVNLTDICIDYQSGEAYLQARFAEGELFESAFDNTSFGIRETIDKVVYAGMTVYEKDTVEQAVLV